MASDLEVMIFSAACHSAANCVNTVRDYLISLTGVGRLNIFHFCIFRRFILTVWKNALEVRKTFRQVLATWGLSVWSLYVLCRSPGTVWFPLCSLILSSAPFSIYNTSGWMSVIQVQQHGRVHGTIWCVIVISQFSKQPILRWRDSCIFSPK